MFKFIKRVFENKSRKMKEEKQLKECGCCCFCPSCKDVLTDVTESNEDGTVTYQCSSCGELSEFHFGIAPVPIYLGDMK